MPTRRGLLLSAGLLAGSWASLRPKAVWAGARRDLFAAAWMRDGLAGFSVLDGDGTILRDVALPDRGHDVAADRTGRWIVAFARRPGRFAVAVDRTGDSAPIAFATPPDRHFFGHGVFSPDGALLYATENDFDAAAGVIGIYDATAGFVRIGEFPTFGMDPHELLLLGDGRTLAIANGGIETHPDYGRAKLNLSTMQPCVVFIDRENGTLIEKHNVPPGLSQLSTRHMDMTADGAVWIGCQWEGPPSARPPLLLRAAPGEAMQPVEIAELILARLSNYVGSVAVNRAGNSIALTSPHGNCALIVDAMTGAVRRIVEETDVCGVAANKGGFLFSDGEGGFGASVTDRIWDNHIAQCGADFSL